MLCLCAASMSLYAQWMPDDSRKLDTLTVADRLSFRTNGVDWLLMMPNIGIEYDIANNKNWNRWSVGVNVRYKWATPHTFVPNHVFDIFETKLEFRNYWRTRRINGSSVKAHRRLVDKAMSQRRYEQKHPLTTYYRGLFASFADYKFRLGPGSTGYQGKALMGGFTYGIQRPLYRFRRGTSIDLELGVSAGLAWLRYNEFLVDRKNNKINVVSNGVGWKDLKIVPIVNELRAGLVYRIGKKSGLQKYRFRYDVDLRYAYMVDSLRDERAAKQYRDSVATSQYKTVYEYYQQQLDSIVKANPAEAKSDMKQQRKERTLLKKESKLQNKENARKQATELSKSQPTEEVKDKSGKKSKKKSKKSGKESRKEESSLDDGGSVSLSEGKD